jgi:hypothetical protein
MMISASLLFLLSPVALAVTPVSTPRMARRQREERTCFQSYDPYGPDIDVRSDVAIVYGVDPSLPQRLTTWRERGYITHVMTGVSWGSYQDYLYGRFDGKEHLDEAQTRKDGTRISHGGDVYYMVPAVSFGEYLKVGVKRAIDAGAEAIHLEEPEFWVAAGYSDAFKREWQSYFHEPWQPPDSSPEARYRSGQLKYYLYRRALGQVFQFVRDYSQKIGRPVRTYVPTHSMLNYANWGIVSPESSLVDLPGCDGYIGQVWTGTARTPNVYNGVTRERTFETAFLEYGVLHNLVRATGRRVWYLADPIEDSPDHTWADYRVNYQHTLAASLLFPDVWRFEVMPWPGRIFRGTYPKENGTGKEGIPPAYATQLLADINVLNDMRQTSAKWEAGPSDVGVLVSDTMMFERGEPADTNARLEGFYGLALPLLKRGIPVTPVQLENAKLQGYLKPYRLLILSYEFMKPPSGELHQALQQWVQSGGVLLYVGDGTDPYHKIREWWNTNGMSYPTPAEHLMHLLGVPEGAQSGTYRFGRGRVVLVHANPKEYAQAGGAQRVLDTVRSAYALTPGGKARWKEQPYVLLQRGPYTIVHVFDESAADAPLTLHGQFIDLFDGNLSVVRQREVRSGESSLMIDLSRVGGSGPRVLASASRIYSERRSAHSYSFVSVGPQGVECVTRVRLAKEPRLVVARRADGSPAEVTTEWNAAAGVLGLRYANSTEGVRVTIQL